MALRAGYYGLKRKLIDKLTSIAGGYDALAAKVSFLDTTGAVTVTAPEGITVNANTQLKRSGRIVTGCIRLEFSEVPTAGSTIATIALPPYSSTYQIAVENAGGKTMPVIVEKTTGNVKLFGAYQPSSGNQLIIMLSYVMEDPASKSDDERSLEVIPEEEPVVVKKTTTRKSTKKTEEEE